MGGKFLFSIPLTLLSLAIVKLKGFSIIQLIGLFRLIQTLRRSGRFSFNQNQNIKNSSTLSLEEAYKILNLDKNKKNSKDDINKAYINIQKKINSNAGYQKYFSINCKQTKFFYLDEQKTFNFCKFV